jgi:hypothetical protein
MVSIPSPCAFLSISCTVGSIEHFVTSNSAMAFLQFRNLWKNIHYYQSKPVYTPYHLYMIKARYKITKTGERS